eukprot:TRINITY_DN4855_c0_g1_i1.p1 TRINITY_DN4855_c0_g1~~TRINITY_DN4855_c0_g1_i1.p1  ORF type:complete len:292 (+),score=47.32 TRINITY_DN4855_c0_g1_i1:182-1057(+)
MGSQRGRDRSKRKDVNDGVTYGPNHTELPLALSNEQWPRAEYPGKFQHMITFNDVQDFALFWHLKTPWKGGQYFDLGIRYHRDLIDQVDGQCGPEPDYMEIPESPANMCPALTECCSRYSVPEDDGGVALLEVACQIDWTDACCNDDSADVTCCDAMSPSDCTINGCGIDEICDEHSKMCLSRGTNGECTGVMCPEALCEGGNPAPIVGCCGDIDECPTECKPKRNFEDSIAYCESIGKKIASIHSPDEFESHLNNKGKLDCKKYIGASSDGDGNWHWIDGTEWKFVTFEQ